MARKEVREMEEYRREEVWGKEGSGVEGEKGEV